MNDEQMGGEQYAVPMSTVREFIVPPQVRRVPNAQEHVRGIISLRGKVITVLSRAKLLNLDANPSSSELQRRIIVLENGEVRLGIDVDEVKEVFNIAQYELEPPPTVVGQETFVDGILTLEERLILMLNVPALFVG